MSIPTVAVTCIAYDQNGNPVAGGLFRARLDRTETYNGFVVPEQVTGTADANGVAVLQLWPNALGVAGSSYRVTAINPDTRQQYLNTTAVVPNSACNLHEIIVAAPFPPVDASEQALIAAQGALALVTAQAGIATNAATEAQGHAEDAEDSATDAQGFAANASASFVDFDKRYLGTKTSDPIVDNQGNALQIGALYYLNNVGLRIYDGNIWSAAYISESSTLTTSDIGVTVQAQSANLNDFADKTAPSGDVVGTTDTQTLTNKSISGTDNTLTSIANSSLVNSSVTVNGQTIALGASTTVTATATNPLTIGTGLNGSSYNGSAPVTVSLANTAVTPGSYGSASNTLTATANAQGQLTALAATPIAIANTQVSGLGTASVLDAAVALGAATLDAGGKVPLTQIPQSIQGGMIYQGSWNADTNTPTIVSSTGSKGHYYVVSVAGTTTIDGISDWLPGDWIIFNGTVWEKIDNTDSVTSVNGYIGAVSLNAADVGAPPTTRTITAGTGLTGGGDLSANRTIEIDSSVVTLTGSQTLTNKTLTSPSITNPTGIVASDVGLGNVDNTSDATKNSATATLTNKTINLTSNTLVATSAQLRTAVTDETGTGSLVFGTNPTITGGTLNPTTLQEGGVAAVVQTDIGTAPNEIPLNQYLGNLAYQDAANIAGDLRAGSINNTPIGATTANTGAFTTLTTSSTVTHNGGTANGVAYLNGSKVLTTGSALTFDGSRFTVQASTPAATPTWNAVDTAVFSQTSNSILQLHVGASGGTLGFGFSTASTRNAGLISFDTGSPSYAFSLSGSEQMRLTPTGLGIGTSSPTNRLSVDGNANITGNTTLGDASTNTVTVNGYMGVGGAATSSIAAYIRNTALTGTTQHGIVSSPVGSTAGTSDVSSVSGQPGTNASAYTVTNAYSFWAFDAAKGAGSTITNLHGLYVRDQTQGTNNYGITSLVSSGTNKWNIYASGTAANYFAGNVGIGTSSPNASALLDVQSTTKGVRMPNMTTTQKNAIASPAAGLMVFDTTLSKLCVYTGAAWETITSA